MGLTRSNELFNEAQKYMPGGVNSPVRSFQAVGGIPPFIKKGHGSLIWDVDGNEYIDYVGSWGPLILGHGHPDVTKEIKTVTDSGTSFGAPIEKELELARLISKAFPSIELLRLVNSGTEACMSAIRLARAYTGRNKIIKFAGCYHGHVDALLVKAGSGAMTHGKPTSSGVPYTATQETLIAHYNDISSVESLFDIYTDDIAGIIIEPVAGNMGVVPPQPGFLEGLRRLTSEHDAMLIMDEVITGFRVSYGGAQEVYNIIPDITCLGKIIGGGLPVGAYGAKREIMEMVSPLGSMYQAGTLSGNPLAISAGVATLKVLQKPGFYKRLEKLGAILEDGLAQAALSQGVPITINRVGSALTIFFSSTPVRTYSDVEQTNVDRYARFFHGMLNRGVYLAPSQYEAAFLSSAHTEKDIDRTLLSAKRVLKELN